MAEVIYNDSGTWQVRCDEGRCRGFIAGGYDWGDPEEVAADHENWHDAQAEQEED